MFSYRSSQSKHIWANSRLAGTLVFSMAAWSSISLAQPPRPVHRGTLPGNVATSPPIAWVTVGPFDDGDPMSAPVGSLQSPVSALPATVAADGQCFITVTIVPQDEDSVPLGSGLSVDVQASGIWPGTLLAPVEDMGNGTYIARVTSDIPGSGQVRVDVEG